MKKLAMLILAFAATLLSADSVLARGGRGGGGRGGGGRGGSSRGRGLGVTGRGVNTGSNARRNNPKDKKSRQLMKDRALAENKDAVKRDARVDSV